MNLKAMRLIWVLFLFSSSFLRGGEKPPIQLVADATFLSQYVAHGLDLSDGGPVIQGTVIANHVLIPNLEVGFIYSYTLDRDDRIWDETGPGIRYTGVLFEDKAYALKSLSFLYYWNYPHYDVAFDKDFEPIDEDHFQGLKFEQTFFLPELIRLGKVALVPSYKLSHWRTIKDEMFEEGFQHEFGLEAIVPVEGATRFDQGHGQLPRWCSRRGRGLDSLHPANLCCRAMEGTLSEAGTQLPVVRRTDGQQRG